MAGSTLANDNDVDTFGINDDDVDHVRALIWELLDEFIEDAIPHATVAMCLAEVLTEYVPGDPDADCTKADEGDLRSGLIDLTLARRVIRDAIRDYSDKLNAIETEQCGVPSSPSQ